MIRRSRYQWIRFARSSTAVLPTHNFSTSTTTNQPLPLRISRNHPTHLIFGANTDVGKTVISTSLIRSCLTSSTTPVHYIKPLQCGQPTDVDFVLQHTHDLSSSLSSSEHQHQLSCHSLFAWETPASPHLASRYENLPIDDQTVLSKLHQTLANLSNTTTTTKDQRIFIEGAGGVMSPSSSSPHNTRARHAFPNPNNNHNNNTDHTPPPPPSWGWSTQADLYQTLRYPVVLIGDGKLGGISTTISALESLLVRGYDIHAVVLLENHDDIHGSNTDALREYVDRTFRLRSGDGRPILQNPERSVMALPPLPPQPEPLEDWYRDETVVKRIHDLNRVLVESWEVDVERKEMLVKEGTDVLWWPFTQHKDFTTVTQSSSSSEEEEGGKKQRGILIDAAFGDEFSILAPSNTSSTTTTNNNDNHHKHDHTLQRINHFDACASWWTQGLGHGESSLALAAAAAAGRYGHIIFPNIVHEPALTLADRLIHSETVGPGRGWAQRVFFSDDGSTAMEVAIKMAMRKYCTDHGIVGEMEEEGDGGVVLTVCAQKDCYHGDTLGVMDVAEPSVFNEGQHPWYEPKGLFLDYPTLRYVDGRLGLSFPKGGGSGSCLEYQEPRLFERVEDAMDVEGRLGEDLYGIYKDSIRKEWDSYEAHDGGRRLIGSVVIETILLGAGGMKFVDPLWQRALVDVARSKKTPVIYDEIASGFFRLGVASCREIIGADPDIACYAKLLTGGLVPMSVTLASRAVFDCFLGDSKAEALLHGHSYTAHPVGCVSALHALDTFDRMLGGAGAAACGNKEDGTDRYFDTRDVSSLSQLAPVQESMGLGTVLAVTIRPDDVDGGGGYAAASASRPIVEYLFAHGVYARPLGNVVYVMVSPLTSKLECKRLCGILRDAIESVVVKGVRS